MMNLRTSEKVSNLIFPNWGFVVRENRQLLGNGHSVLSMRELRFVEDDHVTPQSQTCGQAPKEPKPDEIEAK